MLELIPGPTLDVTYLLARTGSLAVDREPIRFILPVLGSGLRRRGQSWNQMAKSLIFLNAGLIQVKR